MNGTDIAHSNKESGSPVYLLRGKMVLPEGLAQDGLLAWTAGRIIYAGSPEGLPASIRDQAVPVPVSAGALSSPGSLTSMSTVVMEKISWMQAKKCWTRLLPFTVRRVPLPCLQRP